MENVETKDTIAEQGAGAAVEVKDNEALYQKFDDIASKRLEGIFKNVLKTNGFEDDELKAILDGYKQRKVDKTKAVDDEIENLKRENAELASKIKSGKKSAAINQAAADMGISASNLKHVQKLADLSNIEKDGEYDVEAIKAAFELVLEEVPAFKPETKEGKENGFVKIGGKKNEQTQDEIWDNHARAMFELPNLQK